MLLLQPEFCTIVAIFSALLLPKILHYNLPTTTIERNMYMMNQSYFFKNGYYFMLGDNRLFSEDSRIFGPLAKTDIIGKANYK